MTFHIVLDKAIDLDTVAAEAALGKRPGHAMASLRDRLNAVIHVPERGHGASFADGLRSRLVGSPSTWSLARRLAQEAGRGDVIFCASEHTGYPMGSVVGAHGKARVAVMVHNVDRPRTRSALRAFRVQDRIAMFMSPSRPQIEYLATAGVPDYRRQVVADQTDINFFRPGESSGKDRPLIVSVGLEQRDYRTLALATENVDLDVRISGFSSDAALLADTFPDPMPSNFQRAFYEWPDLAQLYRDADIVVVAVRANRYAAGVQALLEAMASGRPVVVTESPGLAGYLDDRDALTVVPQGDAAAMRSAIDRLLADPLEARARASRSRDIAERRYSAERHVTALEQILRRLA